MNKEACGVIAWLLLFIVLAPMALGFAGAVFVSLPLFVVLCVYMVLIG